MQFAGYFGVDFHHVFAGEDTERAGNKAQPSGCGLDPHFSTQDVVLSGTQHDLHAPDRLQTDDPRHFQSRAHATNTREHVDLCLLSWRRNRSSRCQAQQRARLRLRHKLMRECELARGYRHRLNHIDSRDCHTCVHRHSDSPLLHLRHMRALERDLLQR